MDITTFVGRHGTVEARLRQIMRVLHQAEPPGQDHHEGPLTLSLQQGEGWRAGDLILEYPGGACAILDGQGVAFLDPIAEKIPAWTVFGTNLDAVMRALWPLLPRGHVLHATAHLAVLAGPEGVWMAYNPKVRPFDTDFYHYPDYAAVDLPVGHMAVSGSGHARMAFFDSALGGKLRQSWNVSAAELPEDSDSPLTIMFRSAGQSLVCCREQGLRILHAWRDEAV